MYKRRRIIQQIKIPFISWNMDTIQYPSFYWKGITKRQAGKSRFNRTLKFEDASFGRNLKTKKISMNNNLGLFIWKKEKIGIPRDKIIPFIVYNIWDSMVRCVIILKWKSNLFVEYWNLKQICNRRDQFTIYRVNKPGH